LTVIGEVQELEHGKLYKNLRWRKVRYTITTNERKIKEGITHRSKNDTESKLNSKNKITAIGVLGVQVFRYSFDIINWRL
jgi:hypothetical protein